MQLALLVCVRVVLHQSIRADRIPDVHRPDDADGTALGHRTCEVKVETECVHALHVEDP